ncbi:hypothetical protein [Yoonia sp. SS1-5]|uniref:Uncharacterized protein n=1 Tax=Yoonia rhodophyticola TaxID=3137370 RepID=A0AAN0M8Y5_9RHOB
MFRLLRLIMFTMFAFVAGVFYERSNARTACEGGGGLWIDTICVGSELIND